jgi:flavin reductase (DIM6/NTAB) family NADH-FMN oxidoreductase RutF
MTQVLYLSDEVARSDCEDVVVLNYSQPEREPVRRAIGSFAAGVTVITTRDEAGAPVGMTATAFTAVSFEPASVLVCLSLSARTHSLIRASGRYGVNLLGAHQQEQSNYCAVPGQDKVLPGDWLDNNGHWHTPCLKSALAFFDCVVSQTLETGTHVMAVGLVRGVGLSPLRELTSPLLHYRGAYRQLAPVLPGTIPDPLPVVFEDSLILEAH